MNKILVGALISCNKPRYLRYKPAPVDHVNEVQNDRIVGAHEMMLVLDVKGRLDDVFDVKVLHPFLGTGWLVYAYDKLFTVHAYLYTCQTTSNPHQVTWYTS
jgi:hypothetical protein